MTFEVPRPRPAPEWVGDSEEHRDVSLMSDRAIAVMSLDSVLKLTVAVRHLVSSQLKMQKTWEDEKIVLLSELPDHAKRIAALEAGPMRDEVPSSHEWNEMMQTAGVVLSQRVKDPKDRIDSSRAREIAKEVIESVKTVDDARTFRALKSRSWAWGLEILKLVVAAGLGALAAHYGLHIG